jgi:Ca2+-transporting ATPase
MTQVVLMAGAILLGWEIPLLTAQVLWVNLVSDSLPALALTVDPHVLDLMHRPPYKRNEPLIDKTMLTLIGVISLVSGLIALGVFGWGRSMGLPIEVLRTLTFTVVVGCTLILVYASRSMNTSLWHDPFWRNGWLNMAVLFGLGVQILAVYSTGLQALLSTVALPAAYWLVVAGAALVVVLAIELTKSIYASMKT